MSGVIKISDTTAWVKAGWAYDSILKRMADIIRSKDTKLADMLMHCTTEMNVGYCDLRKLDDGQFMEIVWACANANSQLLAAGPQSFAKPEFYSGFVKIVGLLLDMLKSDPRADKTSS